MSIATSYNGSPLTDPLTPKPRTTTFWSQRSRIILHSPEDMSLLQNDVNRLRVRGKGYLRGDVGNRSCGETSTSMGVTSEFDSAPLASLFSLQWHASPRHAMYSNTAHRSSALNTFVFDTSWANSIRDIVGNLIWYRTDPSTVRWFPVLTAIPRRWHSLMLHARHAWNTVSSLTDKHGNCTIFSSVLSAITNYTANEWLDIRSIFNQPVQPFVTRRSQWKSETAWYNIQQMSCSSVCF